jgi:plasmid stabilization system protein ParE
MRKVQWSEDALADIQAQVIHIARDNPVAARRIAIRIRETGDALADFATGHPGRVGGTYEKSIRRLPYILAYVLGDDVLTIVRVMHASRDWTTDEWPK